MQGWPFWAGGDHVGSVLLATTTDFQRPAPSSDSTDYPPRPHFHISRGTLNSISHSPKSLIRRRISSIELNTTTSHFPSFEPDFLGPLSRVSRPNHGKLTYWSFRITGRGSMACTYRIPDERDAEGKSNRLQAPSSPSLLDFHARYN